MCKTALALGTFDGLHMAHREVLSLADGYENKVAITFSVPPAMIIAGKCELIISAEEKAKKLNNLGFSTDVLDFSTVRNMEPEKFLRFLVDKYNPQMICCGFNYRFGKNAAGDIDFLYAFCKQQKIELLVAKPVEYESERVSSSRIRRLLADGNIAFANKLLGYSFSVGGTVCHGDGRGRTIGSPTVNFSYPQDIVVVRHGVYAGGVDIDGTRYDTVTYIGNRPTYKTETVVCETNILDFTGNLYEKELYVNLKEFLRDDRKFDTLEELKKQIATDIEKVKNKKG